MSNLPPGYSGYDGASLEAFRCGLCLRRWTETGAYHFNSRDTDPQCPRWGRKHDLAAKLLAWALLGNKLPLGRFGNVGGKVYDFFTWPHQERFAYQDEPAIPNDVVADFFENDLEAR